MAGTKACDFCVNNGGTYSKTVTTTYNIPTGEELLKEDYKEILKYLIDKINK